MDRVEESLPSRERGLKYPVTVLDIFETDVAPFAGAWIEICNRQILKTKTERSLPSRERGLKCYLETQYHGEIGRSLRGSVD